jgi:hypothetical protein
MANSRLTLGRLGLDIATGTEVDPYPGITWEGDRLSFSGMLKADTTNAGAMLRHQLNGYGPENTDESVIPVIWSQDESVTGYYVPITTEVQADDGTYVGDNWWFPFQADLVRIPGYKNPLMEVICSGAKRDSDAGVTNGQSWCGVPSAASGTFQTATGSITRFNSVAADGDDAAMFVGSTGLYDNGICYYAAPSDFYDAACKVQISVDSGTTWRTLTGRQWPYDLSTSTLWRISNDVARVGSDTNGVGYNFSVGIYDSAWESKGYKLTADTSGTAIGGPSSLRILRNSPEVVAVRAVYGGDSGTYADFTLRRGSWLTEIYLSHGSTYVSASEYLGVFRTTAEAGGTITGGLQATGDDADGNKYRLYSANAFTRHNTNGGIYLTTAAHSVHLGISSDAVTLNAGLFTSHDLYFAAMNHKQRIVSR